MSVVAVGLLAAPLTVERDDLSAAGALIATFVDLPPKPEIAGGWPWPRANNGKVEPR